MVHGCVAADEGVAGETEATQNRFYLFHMYLIHI